MGHIGHPALPLLQDALAPFAEEMARPDFEDLLIQKPGEAWVRIAGVMRRISCTRQRPLGTFGRSCWATTP